ncbi:MarR family winged helix-turn-helix transcriptional regulator [Paeniglutamicibacter sp. NPDC091659]|uniref:MarR family winged helix-turn-helix transcriptional regulator n=1 Tax=Paeniglutamicibacter sp. NPDC091659 TaxID=3364389 RepID=UPI00382243C5
MVQGFPDDSPELHTASRLLHEVLVLNDALEHSMCRHLNINETDFQALQHLIRFRSMTPGELATRLHISTAATTAVIDRMSERGHVLRAPHPTDRRSFLISPSPAAITQTLTALRPLFNDAERVVQALAPEEQQAVVRYLDAMLEAMNTQIDTMETPTTKNRSGRS